MPGRMIKLRKGDIIENGPKCACGSDTWELGEYCIECVDCGGRITSKGQIDALIKEDELEKNCGFGDFLIGGRRTKSVNCGGSIELHPEEGG